MSKAGLTLNSAAENYFKLRSSCFCLLRAGVTSVAQAGLELTEVSLPLPLSAGLKTCATTPGFGANFLSTLFSEIFAGVT